MSHAPRLAVRPPPSLSDATARLLAREGLSEVMARLSATVQATAEEQARRTAVTAPPGADDAAARVWAKRPVFVAR